MSRREDRSLESKRHRSRFDREPTSPKRSRRDGGKAETERPQAKPELDRDRVERDHRHHRRHQDSLPSDASLSRDSKVESGTVKKESENRIAGHQGGGTKHSADSTKVPQSRSYSQHDDRGNVGQNGRSFSRRTDSERGWWRDPKDQPNDRLANKNVSCDAQQKNEKAKDNREDNHARWTDWYLDTGANQIRKRPSFREQKIPAADQDKTTKPTTDPLMPNPQDHSVDSGRRNERGYSSRHYDRPERPFAAVERDTNKAQSWRDNFSSRDRSSAASKYGGRDRFTSSTQGYRPTGDCVEKWKHDLYDEANKSPTPKKEEDQISKIEALLAS